MQEEKDFIMRQTKMLAQGLGAFLKKESADELLSYGNQQSDEVTENNSYVTHKENLDKKVAAEIEKFSKEEVKETPRENDLPEEK